MKKAKLRINRETIISALEPDEMARAMGGIIQSTGCPTMSTKPACDPKPPEIVGFGESA